jgi:hypothetical protein
MDDHSPVSFKLSLSEMPCQVQTASATEAQVPNSSNLSCGSNWALNSKAIPPEPQLSAGKTSCRASLTMEAVGTKTT